MNYSKEILEHIDINKFKIPIKQTEDFFPDFLKTKLSEYVEYYKMNILEHVDEKIPFEGDKKFVIIDKIEKLVDEINKVVEKYYEGNILQSTQLFNQVLDDILFDELHKLDFFNEIEANSNFYRARKCSNDKVFSKEDLFHIKFEDRHLVSTNRFSVIGFPALYLGDSTYTCWEEYGQHKLRDLYFSRLINTRKLKIVRIEKIEDLFNRFKNPSNTDIFSILSYFVLFPLTISCSITVRNRNGNFKPEYIIPQLLLQYISQKDEIQGIKFPSTRIDYTKLTNIQGYNYVFPVKNIKKSGFCETLKDIFHSTEPTSLELEEIINNPIGTFMSSPPPEDGKKIELIKGIKSKYIRTSFGKIEYRLLNRNTSKIITAANTSLAK